MIEKSGGQERALMKQGPGLCFQQSRLQNRYALSPEPPLSGLGAHVLHRPQAGSRSPVPLQTSTPMIRTPLGGGPTSSLQPCPDPAPSASEQHRGERQAVCSRTSWRSNPGTAANLPCDSTVRCLNFSQSQFPYVQAPTTVLRVAVKCKVLSTPHLEGNKNS